MSDLIQILPDSVANQIAAGEVIQRPASVVKELVENAIDAGATSIKVNLKDAGKTLIQIIDNGSGMSETDARLSFERHATSKIRKATDLFSIRSMGFRGEALASIAAIANVELKTKRMEDELGTDIHISGSEFEKQEAISCPNGSNFIVKNLFYNIPARRKFLKANSTELRNIITEFHRIVLSNPSISFKLIHNDNEIFNLPTTKLRQRIINVFGKNINQRLIKIDTDTSIVKLTGFIGKPKYAKKNSGEQFLFVNSRFMRHSYFHRAVLAAYDKILPADTIPPYFIFFEVDPNIIDINIHPTKTEIKFEDEKAVFQIIQASIREALGKFNIIPSIDFEEDTSLEIPIAQKSTDIESPSIEVNPDFNPFEHTSTYNPFSSGKAYNPFEQDSKSFENNQFYQEFKSKDKKESSSRSKSSKNKEIEDASKDFDDAFLKADAEDTITSTKPSAAIKDKKPNKEIEHITPEVNIFSTDTQQEIESFIENEQDDIRPSKDISKTNSNLFQLRNKYIITPIISGLMVIDQRRAHERILFEKINLSLNNNQGIAQQTLFPETIELNASDFTLLQVIIEDVRALGFDIREFGKKTFVINGTPADIPCHSARDMIEDLLENYKSFQSGVKLEIRENLAKALAQSSAMRYGKSLSNFEMSSMIDQLFACKQPHYTPKGKLIISVVETKDIDSRFK